MLSAVWLFATPWTVVCQAPLSVGTLQARILGRVDTPSSRGSFQPRDRTCVYCSSCIEAGSSGWATKKDLVRIKWLNVRIKWLNVVKIKWCNMCKVPRTVLAQRESQVFIITSVGSEWPWFCRWYLADCTVAPGVGSAPVEAVLGTRQRHPWGERAGCGCIRPTRWGPPEEGMTRKRRERRTHWWLARPDPGHPGCSETLQGGLPKLSSGCTLKSPGSFSKALSLGLTLDQLD